MSFVSLFLLSVFIVGILVLLLVLNPVVPRSINSIISRSEVSEIGLREYIRREPKRKPNRPRLFTEESVISLGHLFVGRFDHAILHWNDSPVLDLVIEKKFPRKYLPERVRPEDLFQSGLYATALMESGVSCSDGRLVVIYCRQDDAVRCQESSRVNNCLSCNKGKVFVKRFRPKKVLKDLKRLDEIWFHGRKPKAAPSPRKCRPCPYKLDGRCQFAVT